MNQDQIMKLSDEEQQTKAAELAGWVKVGSDDPHSAAWNSHPWINPRGTGCRDLPDYLNDSAAAWELESFLATTYASGEVEDTRLHYGHVPKFVIGHAYQDAHPWARYIHALGDICSSDLCNIAYEDFGRIEYKDLFMLVHASPRDRTRAFILAMEPDDE